MKTAVAFRFILSLPFLILALTFFYIVYLALAEDEQSFLEFIRSETSAVK